jgi:hypothetical protein
MQANEQGGYYRRRENSIDKVLPKEVNVRAKRVVAKTQRYSQ